MAIFFNNAYCKIWDIKREEEKYTQFTMTTSEKDKDGKYINSNWLATAIGHAHNQMANGEVGAGDRTQIAKGKVVTEKYEDKEGNKRSITKVIVFEFNIEDDGEEKAPPKKKKEVPPKKKAAPKKKPEPVEEDEDEESDVISDEDDSELPF